jgi:hypothetical protein
MGMSEYSERDASKLEPYYSRHVAALTDENLLEKSDIAAELGFRDAEIARLRAAAPADEATALARQIATYMHAKNYANITPYWEPLPDLLGVLTQISNMAAGLTRAASHAPEHAQDSAQQKSPEPAALQAAPSAGNSSGTGGPPRQTQSERESKPPMQSKTIPRPNRGDTGDYNVGFEEVEAARAAQSQPSAPASERAALQGLYDEYLRLHGCFPLPHNKGYAAMSAARAALAAPPAQWISVKDWLPAEHGTYLVAYREFETGPNIVADDRWYGNWWVDTHVGMVSHWMPLPAPTAGDQQEDGNE